MLKEKGGGEKAMVVDEGLTYRVALIWIKRGFDGAVSFVSIEQTVAEINSTLDHLGDVARSFYVGHSISLKQGWLV